MVKRMGILTGGGDCPGLNPAIRGTVYGAVRRGWECVGLMEGWKGLMEAQTVTLNLETAEELINKGGTCLGTSRTNPYKKEGGPQACAENFRKLGLDALVAMGGDDTLGVAMKLNRDSKIPVVGVPKTMDNDLSGTDYTFGFDTSVTVALDALERLRDTGRSHRRIMVLEVMGRHAGWVALFTAVAGGADYCCIPERKVDAEDMVDKLRKAYGRKKYAIVVASEAAELPVIGEDIHLHRHKLDEFGHQILKERGVAEKLSALIEKKTGMETRSAVIGHIQRGGSPTLFDRMLATRVGLKAAELVHEGKFGLMVALQGCEVKGVPLEVAVGRLKTVSKEWLDIADMLF
ncbi:MAG: ATP-dependent 6-phosphofructokinase [bacterium]